MLIRWGMYTFKWAKRCYLHYSSWFYSQSTLKPSPNISNVRVLVIFTHLRTLLLISRAINCVCMHKSCISKKKNCGKVLKRKWDRKHHERRAVAVTRCCKMSDQLKMLPSLARSHTEPTLNRWEWETMSWYHAEHTYQIVLFHSYWYWCALEHSYSQHMHICTYTAGKQVPCRFDGQPVKVYT